MQNPTDVVEPASASPGLTEPGISVVIPVYNASGYVRRAVRSALIQPEVAEVVLAEDGSTDGSSVECDALARADPRVRVLRHPGGGNRGAGAARNLGLAHVNKELVAFLDADDYYTPQRFQRAVEVLRDPAVDGVYEAIGIEYDSVADRDRFLVARPGALTPEGLTTLAPGLAPEMLCETLLVGGAGFCHLDGLTIRRRLLNHAGVFNEDLRLHQDTHLLIRLAYHGRLLPGVLDRPVAIRWVHKQNRITAAMPESSTPYQRILWRTLLGWALEQGAPIRLIQALAWRGCVETPVLSKDRQRQLGRFGSVVVRAGWLVREFVTAPGLMSRWMATLVRHGVLNPLPRRPAVSSGNRF